MIFTDHAIMYVSTRHQLNLLYGEYLRTNLKCEKYATNCGILVQAYHTKNDILNSDKLFDVIIGQEKISGLLEWETLIRMGYLRTQ